jgi:hypothetical protein
MAFFALTTFQIWIYNSINENIWNYFSNRISNFGCFKEDFMKLRNCSFFILTICILTSCISLETRGMTQSERSGMRVIGTVTAEWTAFNFFNIRPSAKTLENKAISELKAAAQKQGYKGNIDIRNISVAGNYHMGNIPLFFFTALLFGNLQAVVASGDVVEITQTGTSSVTSANVEGALDRAAAEVSKDFSARSRLAIVYITTQDRGTTDYITGELEHILRNRGFTIVDRAELDRVRAEQRFGATDEVDDNTAARIGRMAGASIVITGRIDGEGNLRRLRLRALDATTAVVVGTASQRL